jgi:hypothetical protein
MGRGVQRYQLFVAPQASRVVMALLSQQRPLRTCCRACNIVQLRYYVGYCRLDILHSAAFGSFGSLSIVPLMVSFWHRHLNAAVVLVSLSLQPLRASHPTTSCYSMLSTFK